MAVSPEKQHHFLLVTFGSQSQINPARKLAGHLSATFSARVTHAIPMSAYRSMFPSSSSSSSDQPDSLISFAPYSNGYDDGFKPEIHDGYDFMQKLRTDGSRTLSLLAADLAAGGRPVTCVIYAILLSWVADVARELKVPSFHYWLQSASVFSVYYHHVRGLVDVGTDVTIPGLPTMRPRDLPSFLTESNLRPFLQGMEETFRRLELQGKEGDSKPKVLINTFHDLEAEAISVMKDVDFVTIGPMMGKATSGKSNDLYEEDSKDYIKWLDGREDRSVVYVSFGSLSKFTPRQIEEILKALRNGVRPFLLVLRRNNREGIDGLEMVGEEEGMVVAWCSQTRVLEHRAVGCFVTHCGWNSMLEALVGGVPTVMMPQWTDQLANARIGEEGWGVGVTAELGDDRVVAAEELKRCVEVVMGEEEKGREIRRRVAEWSEKAKEAAREDGAAARNLKGFVEAIES